MTSRFPVATQGLVLALTSMIAYPMLASHRCVLSLVLKLDVPKRKLKNSEAMQVATQKIIKKIYEQLI